MTKTCMDSPALEKRSDSYPASWRDRVPKRIKMAKDVTSELPMFLPGAKKLLAQINVEYDCWVNSHGAVAAILGDEMLGVKPYEFEVIEWHETATAITSVSVESNDAVPSNEIWLVSAGERRGTIYNIGIEERKA